MNASTLIRFEVKFVRNANSAAIDDLIRKISRWQLQGYATVSGIFTVPHGPLDSYTIHVDEVKDVTPGDFCDGARFVALDNLLQNKRSISGWRLGATRQERTSA